VSFPHVHPPRSARRLCCARGRLPLLECR
jgi:hypothetical protein